MIDLDTIEAAARRGLVTWTSVQQVQARAMPRCANHPERVAWTTWIDREREQALCADCAAALIETRKEQV